MKEALMSYVFVLDTNRQPLMPCTPARARILLRHHKAAVFRRVPFTIVLTHPVSNPQTQPLRLKIDPGSRTTGIAIVDDATGNVPFAAELRHRGEQVKTALDHRRQVRRGRRFRHTRYRQARFLNRGRRENWLPPSLESRLANIMTWVSRLMKLCPVAAISLELVKFDTQALQNPEISGVEYQQGTLEGYELREYLLGKWGRMCAYCKAKQVPLQIEHIVPLARGGSNRVFNLTLACESCNRAKGAQTAREFGYPTLQEQAKHPLRDAGAVNTMRWALFTRLRSSELPIEVGTGGRTKYNRCRLNLPKTHWLDAACVGASTPKELRVEEVCPLLIQATGHGHRRRCDTDKYGFPIRHRTGHKRFFGFQTGDIVRARVPSGRKTSGVHIGRVLVRASGKFDLCKASGRVAGVHAHYCSVLQHGSGYSYELG
jgi:5-methylcytosine-specific restriction endonuclease McrA